MADRRLEPVAAIGIAEPHHRALVERQRIRRDRLPRPRAGLVDRVLDAQRWLGSAGRHALASLVESTRSPKPNAPEGATRCRAWTSGLAGRSAVQKARSSRMAGHLSAGGGEVKKSDREVMSRCSST